MFLGKYPVNSATLVDPPTHPYRSYPSISRKTYPTLFFGGATTSENPPELTLNVYPRDLQVDD